MDLRDWTRTPLDEQMARAIQARLPARLFDVHAHLYRRDHLRPPLPPLCADGPELVTAQRWSEHLSALVGEARCEAALFFPLPYVRPEHVDAANDFLSQQLRDAPGSRGLVLIHPEYLRSKTEAYLEQGRFSGFKVYHTWSRQAPTQSADLESFVPEWAWDLANDRGLVILLHMVKKRSLSDVDNQRYLQRMCARYSDAKLVLAHAARGFHAPDTVRGLSSLQGLHNVWFDSSVVCETPALEAILDTFGPRRLMWGSDFPVSHMRGKCVTLGDGFAWLDNSSTNWQSYEGSATPTLVGVESLIALLDVIEKLGFSAQDADRIFYQNARELLGLDAPAPCVQALYDRARQRIPGGTQLLSKRPELMAPRLWPAYFSEARGCEVWDLDGRHYYDFSTNGVGSSLLGYRDPDVTRAVQRRLRLGTMCSLNAHEELQLADRLCEIHPWAQQARFARGGGEAMAVAVRIARATTQRSAVAICGYHGWHDWYLAANLGDDDRLRGHLLPGLEPAGVPEQLRHTAFTFRYNGIEELKEIMERHGDRLAAVVMEPCRFQPPEPGFLEEVKRLTHTRGALLIFDEITIGWRLCFGGAHLRFGVDPDITVFAKALSNGHPMAAIIGTEPAMRGAHDSFISSTYWTESIGPAAALATIAKMQALDVPAHVDRIGKLVNQAWRQSAERYRLPLSTGDGFGCLCHFHFEHELAAELQTLYTQWMLDRGYLAGPSFYPTLAHGEQLVERFAGAIDEVFAAIRTSLDKKSVNDDLRGPPAHSGFKRLT